MNFPWSSPRSRSSKIMTGGIAENKNAIIGSIIDAIDILEGNGAISDAVGVLVQVCEFIEENYATPEERYAINMAALEASWRENARRVRGVRRAERKPSPSGGVKARPLKELRRTDSLGML